MPVRSRHHLDEIEQLDPVADCERIVFLNACYEFPFDNARALEFALFRTFAVPSIGALLDATGEFTRRPGKRYDDTDLLISEFVEHGLHSERGRAAIRRMNQIHGRFQISQDDYRYVLSTFVVEPCRWNERFGWRSFTPKERLALVTFWRQVGAMMNIQDIPPTYEEFEAMNVAYERERFTYSAASRRVALATRELLLKWHLPKPLWPLGRAVVHAMLDEPLRLAFGLPQGPPGLGALIQVMMRGRAWALATLVPARRQPVRRTAMPRQSYPQGYTIEDLGPPPPDAAQIDPKHLKRPQRRPQDTP